MSKSDPWKQPLAGPAELLNLGQELWLKTAGLKGRLAPEIASSLRTISSGTGGRWQELQRCMPEIELSPNIINPSADSRHRIVEALRDYCRSLLAASELSSHGALQATARRELDGLGLRTHLWCLNRAVTRAVTEYEQLCREASPLAQQSTALQQTQFLHLLLSACIEEVDKTLEAFLPSFLRARVYEAFNNKRILDAKINGRVAPALLCLLVQGSMPRREFEMFTGLSPESAAIEVAKLEKLGIMRHSSFRSGWVVPRLPSWFLACIKPHVDESLVEAPQEQVRGKGHLPPEV